MSLAHSQSLQINRSRVLRVGLTCLGSQGRLGGMAGPQTQILRQPLCRFLPHPWLTWATLSDALWKYWGPDCSWLASHGTKRLSKQSCLWWEKGHREQEEHFILVQEKETGPPASRGDGSWGQCRLSRRKWQRGIGNLAGGDQGPRIIYVSASFVWLFPLLLWFLNYQSILLRRLVFGSGACLGFAQEQVRACR